MAVDKMVLASGNAGKIREIQAILPHWQIVPQSEFNVPEADETGLTFVENAIIKARNAAQYSQLPAIADDSGLEVDALQGAPGVISARYAGVGATDQANVDKLLDELQSVPESQRTARFRCVMVLMQHPEDPAPVIAEGVWEGVILSAETGGNGFGYDPLFFVPSEGCSSAQLAASVKNRLSHRGQALQALARQVADLDAVSSPI